jgi:uncharacterized glyoxalase superfamily protein PhnB
MTASTLIMPMLSVTDGSAAIDFYQKAFGAELNWKIGAGANAVAGMSVDGSDFFLAKESPPHGNRSPAEAGFTTVRIELFTDDPEAVLNQAVAAGATVKNPLQEYNYPMEGPKPIPRMVQASVFDPFGHVWLISKVLS